MIAVVDSGVANLESVMSMLRRIGGEAEVTADAGKIKAASHVILPGVGAAAPAMAQLQAKKLTDTLKALTQPVLGICLGLQLMFERSTEGSGTNCLGILPGSVQQLPAWPDRPVPHMGWNQITLKKPEHSLLRGVDNNSFVYFVHSFAAPVADTTLATTDYGTLFAAISGSKNFMGCQFHPERSGAVGGRILKNFLAM